MDIVKASVPRRLDKHARGVSDAGTIRPKTQIHAEAAFAPGQSVRCGVLGLFFSRDPGHTNRFGIALLAIVLSIASPFAYHNTTSGQSTTASDSVTRMEGLLRDAGTRFREAKYREAAAMVMQVEQQLSQLETEKTPPMSRRISAIKRSLRNARAALELQGIHLPVAMPQPRPAGQDSETSPQPAAVSFRSQIAPILVERCLGCHNDDDRQGRLSMTSFESFRRGGETWQPNQPDSSLLIGKLKGTADGQPMPLGEDPLSGAQIALFENWIQEGATNDGGPDDLTIASVLATVRMQNATTDEINQERAKRAQSNWQLAFPSLEPTRTETEHFLILSSLGAEETSKFATQAEANWQKVNQLLRLPAEAGPRGRITLNVVDQVYLLGEFARMVERRELPRPSNGVFWSSAPTDMYVVVLWKREGNDATDATPRGLTGVLLASRGEIPSWFVQGLADTVAQRLSPQVPRVVRLAELQRTLKYGMREPDDFIEGRVPIDVADAAAMSFVQFLMRQGRNFPRLLTQGDQGQPFVNQVESIYGKPLNDLLSNWWSGVEGAKSAR